MIAALFSLIPGRSILYAIAAATIAGLIGWHWAHEAGVRQAAIAAAVAARDGDWQAKIAAAEAETKITLTALQAKADDASAAAEATQAKLDQSLKDLETANASLPKAASCGLDGDRVRLLDRLR